MKIENEDEDEGRFIFSVSAACLTGPTYMGYTGYKSKVLPLLNMK
jgi:hypothetical protein